MDLLRLFTPVYKITQPLKTSSNRTLLYIFALLIPGFSAFTNNLLFKEGLLFNWFMGSLVIVGLWRLNEKLLGVSDRAWLKWGSTFLGSSLFIFVVIVLDNYFFHTLLSFTGFSPFNFYLRIITASFMASVVIEGIKRVNAREQAKLENLQLQTESIETQFNLLIQQANPEFLFNSLDTLQKMVHEDDPQAEQYILKLADVYRQTLKKERTPVSLREELRLVQSYLFLMMYGKETAIFLDITVSDESLTYRLPIFSLQLLAENCIKHNTFSSNQPLYIRVFQKDPKSISMTNNYQPKTTTTPSFGVGINNLKSRYALEGIENGVVIEQNETNYTTTLQLF